MAYFVKRRFDQAVAKLLLSMREHPRAPGAHGFLAACYAHMVRLEMGTVCRSS
jgi:hypothetical protein